MKGSELQELHALDALGILDDDARARLHSLMLLDPDVAEDAGLWRDAVLAFAAAAIPRLRPPERLREGILSRIGQIPQLRPPSKRQSQGSQSAAPISTSMPALGFDFAATAHWLTPAEFPGVRFRVLAVNAAQGYRIIHAVLQPGTHFPAHHHGAGPEDLFILSGDLVTEGRTLRAGDHFHAEPGTDHGEIVSPGGCEALLVEPIAGPEFACEEA